MSSNTPSVITFTHSYQPTTFHWEKTFDSQHIGILFIIKLNRCVSEEQIAKFLFARVTRYLSLLKTCVGCNENTETFCIINCIERVDSLAHTKSNIYFVKREPTKQRYILWFFVCHPWRKDCRKLLKGTKATESWNLIFKTVHV
jgi:hypothetical protein